MTADPIGGVWTYAMELAQAMGPHGVEVVLATMGRRPGSEQRDQVARLWNVELFESDYRLEWMDDAWDDVEHAGEWLLKLEEKTRPDVVHLNGYAHAALPFAAPRLVVGHSCVLSWWRAVKGCGAPPSWDEYRRRVARGVRSADFVVAPSAAMLETLSELYGPVAEAKVIPNGRQVPPALASVRKERFIFAAGRLWDEAKNIAALARVAPQRPWPVYVAGESVAEDSVATPLENFHHLGVLGPDETLVWLARSTIYALPARYEPFGLSVLEAALTRCALVLGDLPNLREYWRGAALFVPPDEPGALARAIDTLIGCPSLRAELSARACRAAVARRPEQMAEAYLGVYRQVLDARSSELTEPAMENGVESRGS